MTENLKLAWRDISKDREYEIKTTDYKSNQEEIFLYVKYYHLGIWLSSIFIIYYNYIDLQISQ